MDSDYAVKLAISILVFAPGLALLAIALFVGVLASLEKTGLLQLAQRRLEKPRAAATVSQET